MGREHDIDGGTYRFPASGDHTWFSFEERRLRELESASSSQAWKLIVDEIEMQYLTLKDDAITEVDAGRALMAKHGAACLRALLDALDKDVRELSRRARLKHEADRREADKFRLDSRRAPGHDRFPGIPMDPKLQPTAQ